MNDSPHYINDTVHVPEEGTHKYRDFWGAYKGHVLGLMRGTIAGGLLGGIIGAAFVGLAVLAAGATFAALPVIAGFSVLGAFFGGDIMGRAGSAAGVVAADKAEMELRFRYPGSGTGIVRDPMSPPSGEGHHYEVPPERDEGKWYHWQTGIPMTLLGLAVGGLVTVALGGFGAPLLAGKLGMLLNPEVAHAMVEMGTAGALTMKSTVLATQGAALATWLPPFLGGTLGLSYGVNRARFKDVFNPIDSVLDGGLIRSRAKTLELAGYQQELTPEAEEGKRHPTITTLERQEEGHRLFYDYFERSFWRATRDSIKGSLGGGVVGAALGLAVGALSFVISPLIPFAPIIMGAVGALGTHEGMKIFSDVGMRSGATSVATDLFEVKRQRLLKGLDPEMDMPDGRGKDRTFNVKRAVVGAILGIAIGAAMLTILGPAILGVIGVPALGGGVVSALAGLGIGAETASALFIGGAVGGLTGAVAGISSRALKNMAGLADSIYDGRILKGDIRQHTTEPCKLPYLSPNSPWLPKDGVAKERAEDFTTTVLQPRSYQPVAQQPTENIAAETPAPTKVVDAAPLPVPHSEAPKRNYPAAAPMGERLQHLIQEREQKGATATQREDDRKMQREAQSSSVVISI